MKEFLKLLRIYISPYKKEITGGIVSNILAAILNLLAFSLIIPILRILFGIDSQDSVSFIPWNTITIERVSDLTEAVSVITNNFSYYIKQLILSQGASYALMLLCIYLVATTFIKCFVTYLAMYFMIPIRTGVVVRLRDQLNKKILSLPMSFMSEEHKGDILARISGDVNEVEYSVISVLESLIKNPILILIYLAALLFISWQLTLFVLILLPIAGYIMGSIGKRLKRDSVDGQNQWGLLMTMIEETLSGLRIIKAFTAENFISDRFYQANQQYRSIVNRVYARQSLAHPMSEFLGTIAIAIILWYGGNLIFEGSSFISAPTFIYYLIIFYSIINPAKDLSRSTYSIQKGLASMDRINAILSRQEEVEKTASEQTTLLQFEKTIEYQNVSFRYTPDKWVLKDINLQIKKGQTIAFVGSSGSGKTTLVDLIPRFYDPSMGSITIDGVDLRQLSLNNLRSLVGYVNQSPILFNDTIFNNIAFGSPSASLEDVKRAAQIAHADEFIDQCPGGYDFNVGDNGTKLSGGQRQRLSIARAILKNPPILIFDEATSALDNHSELIVQEAINHLLKDRTTFIIAHRISTVIHADMICVVESGKIVEQGTHRELLQKVGGVYASLFHSQFKNS